MNRRQFFKATAGAFAFLAASRRAYPFNQSPLGIPKFDATLPGLGPGGANNYGNYIPVLSPQSYGGVDHYNVQARQFRQTLHQAIGSTKFWGYADATTLDSKYLGGVIVAKRGTPVSLRMTNLLPAAHILPVDSTAIDPTMGAEVGGRVDRIAIHLHGGLVHWQHDGGPFAWYSNFWNPGGFVHGSSFINGAGPGAAIYTYPNNQSARFVWYHDHAYGITRINAYAGLASGYLITDDAETQLVRSGLLPDLGGAYPLGIPLVIQDKSFLGTDPNYPVDDAEEGDLWYAHSYEGPPLPTMTIPPLCDGTGRWDVGPTGTPPNVSLVAEFFADTMLVNGAPYPRLPVDRRRYRFRVLNGCQARFLNLQMYLATGGPDGITLTRKRGEADPNGNPVLVPANRPGPRFIQIGTEGGFLPAPVLLNYPPQPIGYLHTTNPPTEDGDVNRYNLLLAPAERADIIVDFRDVPAGSQVILYTDAPAPFPGGDIRNDYYDNDTDMTCIGGAPSTQPGQGPDTRIIMRFDVSSTTSNEMSFEATWAALKSALPIIFRTTQPPPLTRADGPAQVKTLNEDFDNYGRLRQLLGAPDPADLLSVPTDVASRGEVQMWQIYNLTGDTHPMHFHLVNVQVVKREAWAWTLDGSGNPIPILPLQPIPGTARPPDPNEQGWKETVRMNPGQVTTVLMKFDLPPGTAPPSPRLQASYGVKGAEYVWHCHILEHEEHDMMHALVVI